MQDKVYNPFSENSKKMIHDIRNVEYSEMCETSSKVQCSNCLSCWAKGIVYCTCGICLCHTEALRQVESKTIRYLIDFELRDLTRNAFTELDMENLRSRPTITRPPTHGNDAERGKMPRVKITQEF